MLIDFIFIFHMQTLKVKVKVLCDGFEKHESPPENGMLKISLRHVIILFL